ncbi:MAG: hypothetical protein Q9162_001553 [Coniocarpon cinnabarinum]
MDPYRLLTSSTKLLNRHDKSSEAITNDSRGQKRKRSPLSQNTATAQQGTNSLGQQVLDGKEQSTDSQKRSQHVPQTLKHDQPSTSQGQLAQKSSLEQRRNVLKSHKIKVAELWSPLHARHKKAREGRQKDSKLRGSIVPEPLTHFKYLSTQYKVSTALSVNLERQAFTTPTEVQLASLPLLLDSALATKSKDDAQVKTPPCHLLSVAPTGSGKTLAFLIPAMQSIICSRQAQRRRHDGEPAMVRETGPSTIILAPTKELTKQIANEAKKLAQMTGIRTSLVMKTMDLTSVTDVAHGDASNTSCAKSEILVSTPQAILNASRRGDGAETAFPSVSMLILDEADALLDPLFRDQTLSVWSACTHPHLQVSLWSATMGSNIEELTKKKISQRDPPSRLPLYRLVVGLKDSSIPNINHRLVYAASEQGKLMALRQLLHRNTGVSTDLPKFLPPFLVFTQTIQRAIALHAELLYDMPSEAGGSSRIAVLHADLSDTARDLVMTQFRKGDVWILITTDLLARGIDFHGINGVVNYDLPSSSAAYVHRVGRTGRAGREGGVAVTLYSKDDLPFVKNVANVIAASERMRGKTDDESVLEKQWMLHSLPKVTKRDKQMLKHRGVQSRRKGSTRPLEANVKRAKSQISTKSAFERREDNRRRDAVEHSRERKAVSIDAEPDRDFAGFDD